MDRQQSTDLLQRARAGSHDALEVLYRRFAGKLLARIRLQMGRKLRSRMESRDILQATMLRAFQSIDQFKKSDTGSLLAWLSRIAQNEIRDQVDHHAAQRRDAVLDAPLEGADDNLAASMRSALSQVLWNQQAERLEEALEELEEAQRQVVILRKLEELGFQEIGERLGRSPDACRMLLVRAMARLTLMLAEES